MKTKILNIFILIASAAFFAGCVDDSYNTPVTEECVNPGLTKTKEVADLYALAPSNGSTAIYHHLDSNGVEIPDYIEAIIISSDEGGNFYKSMYLQPIDGSKGFNLSIDEVNAYTQKMQPGKKVFLKLNGLAFANPSSFGRGLIFGAAPTEVYAVDRLANYKEFLKLSCDVYNEDDIIKHLTLSQALSDTYLNTLVEIDDVQFKTDCATYSKQDFDTSLKITNGPLTLDVRTSRFANFAGDYVPSGRGKIRGVLSKYNNGYQIVIRTERDVKFTNPRVAVVALPKVGNNPQYLGTIAEPFTSYSTTTTGALMPNYVNDAFIGSRYWDVATFSNNKYLQMSAFGSGCAKTYFIVPVDMTVANTLSFKSKDGYFDGQPLKVYYSMDYVWGGNISQATLVNITDNFSLAHGTTSGYATNFTLSGNYVIPSALAGNGYFIFEYDGTTGMTTTIQLDDVTIQ